MDSNATAAAAVNAMFLLLQLSASPLLGVDDDDVWKLIAPAIVVTVTTFTAIIGYGPRLRRRRQQQQQQLV